MTRNLTVQVVPMRTIKCQTLLRRPDVDRLLVCNHEVFSYLACWVPKFRSSVWLKCSSLQYCLALVPGHNYTCNLEQGAQMTLRLVHKRYGPSPLVSFFKMIYRKRYASQKHSFEQYFERLRTSLVANAERPPYYRLTYYDSSVALINHLLEMFALGNIIPYAILLFAAA